MRPCSGAPPTTTPCRHSPNGRSCQARWVQIFTDTTRAGSGLLNFAVDDLPTHVAGLRQRGLEPGDTTDANKGVHLSAITDPDGNTISLIGGFRVQY